MGPYLKIKFKNQKILENGYSNTIRDSNFFLLKTCLFGTHFCTKNLKVCNEIFGVVKFFFNNNGFNQFGLNLKINFKFS